MTPLPSSETNARRLIGNDQTKRLGSFQVDDELEFAHLLGPHAGKELPVPQSDPTLASGRGHRRTRRAGVRAGALCRATRAPKQISRAKIHKILRFVVSHPVTFHLYLVCSNE